MKRDVELPHARRVQTTLATAERRDQHELAQFYLDRGRRFFVEVHRTNMEKRNGSRRADGKWMKPAGWQPPCIAEMLVERYGYRPPASSTAPA